MKDKVTEGLHRSISFSPRSEHTGGRKSARRHKTGQNTYHAKPSCHRMVIADIPGADGGKRSGGIGGNNTQCERVLCDFSRNDASPLGYIYLPKAYSPYSSDLLRIKGKEKSQRDLSTSAPVSTEESLCDVIEFTRQFSMGMSRQYRDQVQRTTLDFSLCRDSAEKSYLF